MRFNYQGSNRTECFCEIEIIGNLVIATELNDNPGMSITNAAEQVATSVCLRKEIPMDQLIWIECYECTPGVYDLVQFTYDGERLINPIWKRLSGFELGWLKEEAKHYMKGAECIGQTEK